MAAVPMRLRHSPRACISCWSTNGPFDVDAPLKSETTFWVSPPIESDFRGGRAFWFGASCSGHRASVGDGGDGSGRRTIALSPPLLGTLLLLTVSGGGLHLSCIGESCEPCAGEDPLHHLLRIAGSMSALPNGLIGRVAQGSAEDWVLRPIWSEERTRSPVPPATDGSLGPLSGMLNLRRMLFSLLPHCGGIR